jgi:hypothetical protein
LTGSLIHERKNTHQRDENMFPHNFSLQHRIPLP